MQFSPQQDRALTEISRWLKAPDRPVFRLYGLAGTGKTTLARHIAEGVDGEVQFAAFTGKAAQVLRSMGCDNARTIHSLIYRPAGEETDEEDGTVSPLFALSRNSTAKDASLIVIDECSMVGEELGRDLLSFGTPILVLGDPGQLPPITGAGFFTEHEPDVLLTEIHRQARGNPIIHLAHTVREGGRLDQGRHGDSRVVSRGDIDSDEVLEADQVLVGINRSRQRYNIRLRELKGFNTPLPQAGDRLVCLRNNNKKGLLNGSLWEVKSCGAGRGKAFSMFVRSEDEGIPGDNAKVKVLRAGFEGGGLEAVPWKERRRYDEFDFGYALTVHKAQGSQWNNVMLFDESYAFRETRARWLYTAITRAAERITIVQ